jgi:hypothetical protein
LSQGAGLLAHLNDELHGRMHPWVRGGGIHRIMGVVLTQRNPHAIPSPTTLELHKLCVIIPVVTPLMILQKPPHKMIKSKEIIVTEASQLMVPPHLYVQATTYCKGFAPDWIQDSWYKAVPVFLPRGISRFYYKHIRTRMK